MPLRDQFPIFQHKVYLNSCSQGALSHRVRQSYADYLRDWEEKGSPWEYWVERTEAADGWLEALPDFERFVAVGRRLGRALGELLLTRFFACRQL